MFFLKGRNLPLTVDIMANKGVFPCECTSFLSLIMMIAVYPYDYVVGGSGVLIYFKHFLVVSQGHSLPNMVYCIKAIQTYY